MQAFGELFCCDSDFPESILRTLVRVIFYSFLTVTRTTTPKQMRIYDLLKEIELF